MLPSFVARTDFDNPPYSLPSLDDDKLGPGFDQFVIKLQKEVLVKLLGQLLYEAFDSGLQQPSIDPKWIALRDGADYINLSNNRKYNYPGMNAMLQPYIYAKWLGEQFDSMSSFGIVLPATENSVSANPSMRIANAYNDFSKIALSHRRYLPPFANYLLWGNLDNQGSLFGYLYNSGDTYAADIAAEDSDIQSYLANHFEDPRKMNQFSI